MNPHFFDNSQHYEKLKNVCCVVPFIEIQILEHGDVCNCCFSWLPTYIGNILDNTLIEIVSGFMATSIQNSVSDGSFKYCSSELCPKLSEAIHHSKIQYPLIDIKNKTTIPAQKIHINLAYDKSCNLYCGSCRNDRILYTSETAPVKLQNIHSRVLTQIAELENNGYEVVLNVTGSGDPFASPLYWDLIKNIDLNKNYKLHLSTNGTLMTPERLSLPYVHKIEHISISVDAATEKTYTTVRRGGNFKALVQNIKHLDTLVQNNNLPHLKNWRINFVVQAENYFEMREFAQWALDHTSVSEVWFNLIADWGHLAEASFNAKAIWNRQHAEHSLFLSQLADPIFNNKKIILGNLSLYRNAAAEPSTGI